MFETMLIPFLAKDSFHFVKLILAQGSLKNLLYMCRVPIGEPSSMPAEPTVDRGQDRNHECAKSEKVRDHRQRPTEWCRDTKRCIANDYENQ